ncbi:hypothetical protein XANCAGTX0491_003862 [Xanthoria calcicola]
MAINQLNVPTQPPGLFNATADLPLSDGRTFCAPFYGHFADSNDCKNAILKLPAGPTPIPYINDGRFGPGHLPEVHRSGNCMIQIELAGPGNPASFRVAPDRIRKLASKVGSFCVEEGHTGGFITSTLEPMGEWLTSAAGTFDAPFRHPCHPNSTAPTTSFLTVSLTPIVPEYLSPGNYDPAIASVFANAEFDAATRLAPSSRLATTLRARGNRLLRIAQVMDPRGHRIPWWSLPPPRVGQGAAEEESAPEAGVLQRPGGAAAGAWSTRAAGGVGGKPETSAGGGGEATARKARRRRRGGMGEEGVMMA